MAAAKRAVRSRPSLASRIVLWLGVAMLTAGTVLLGYVGWEYYGTTWVAQKEYATSTDDLRSSWEQPQSATPSAAPGDASAAPTTAVGVIPGDAFALLRIPAFGASFEVPIRAGTDPATLARGVGWDADSVPPGQKGNFVIAGHRVTHGEPFRRMLELKVGDQIIVETRTTVFTYLLVEPPSARTVQESETWVLMANPLTRSTTASEPIITLVTCTDLFHSPNRSVGFGRLLSATPK